MNDPQSPESSPGQLSMPLGVILERRESDNQWIDFDWCVTSVLPGADDIDEWVELRKGEDKNGAWVQYHAGTLPLEIFRKRPKGINLILALSSLRFLLFCVIAMTKTTNMIFIRFL